MTRITVERTVHAPVERVFDTVAHVESFREAVPHIVKVEYLSEQRKGKGTRFRETRMMGKREAATELEITEYVENERVRYVADSHGTVWDTVFTVEQAGDGAVDLKMVMDAKAHKFLARIMNALIKGMVAKAVEQDLDMIKAHCEK